MMPDTDIVDVELNERPKTPEAEVIMKQEPPRPHLLPPMPQFPFLPNFGGIPPLCRRYFLFYFELLSTTM